MFKFSSLIARNEIIFIPILNGINIIYRLALMTTNPD
jgi:hypothetical protein